MAQRWHTDETPESGKFGNKDFWTRKQFPRLRQRDAIDAQKWFKSRVDAEMSPNRKLPTDKRALKRKIHQSPQIGSMYIYKYEAKWDKQLPTWD